MIRLFLISALSLGLTLPGFAAPPAQGGKLAEDQTYSFWISDATRAFDPQVNTDADSAEIIRQLFEGLLNTDATGALVPGVAQSFDISDDRLTYRFHLRPDARWSDGDPVTAGDFVYAWRRLADPKTAGDGGRILGMMHLLNAAPVNKGEKKPEELGVSAINDHLLEVRLSVPTPYLPKLLTQTATFPVNRKAIKALGDAWAQSGKLIGNGAYILKGHKLGVQIGMEKNPHYWDAANVVMAHLRGLTARDPLVRYQAGTLDRVPIPAGQYTRLKQQFPDQAQAVPRACTYAYLLNLGDKGPEALQDVRVRKALSYAMPRDRVVEQILQAGQKPAYGWTHWAIEGFQPPKVDYAEWSQADRLDKARALLAEAGYNPARPLKLTLTYNSDEIHKSIATAARQSLKEVGVDLTLDSTEWTQQSERMRSGNFELLRYTWCADYDDASAFLDYFRSTGVNYGRYANPAFDRLMKGAASAADPASQYTAAEKILSEDMPLIPIYHYAAPEMIRDDIRGLPVGNAVNGWLGKDIYRINK